MENKEEENLKINWFNSYIDNLENKAINEDNNKIYNCPCCGYPTLEGRGNYDICPLCKWEDDGQDDPDADEVWGGPNSNYSLTEARNNFRNYLIQYRPDDNGFYQSPEKIEIKKKIINLFNELKNPDIQDLEKLKLSKNIDLLFQKLYKMFCKGIAIHEIKISFSNIEEKVKNCPCCNFPTLTKEGEFDICFLCNWQIVPDDFERGNEDYPTLSEAKENFKKFYTMYSPNYNEYLKQERSEIELKNKIINIYTNFNNKLKDNSVRNELFNKITDLFEELKIKEEKFKKSGILVDDL